MAEAAIRLEDVSKRFRIYRQRHQSLKEVFVRRGRGQWDDLWALRHVSFDVMPGRTVGVIGENGAGKSTLLKLLTGILAPDGGRLSVRGRVSAMIELGAGFQNEYTGRENIYLYGALMGLRRSEIKRHLEEIIDFSELGSFIEYPVKNYSSGMYMRLAFAVSVHLDPDVLLIDEVLAVGDAAFQQKCFERLNKFRKDGRTIVLVSHDLEAVRRFCERVVWLDHGDVAADGPPDNTIRSYLDASASRPGRQAGAEVVVPGLGKLTGAAEITAVRFRDAEGQDARSFLSTTPVTIEIQYSVHEAQVGGTLGVSIFRNDGVYVTDANTEIDGVKVPLKAGSAVAELSFPNLSLGAGTYALSIALYDHASKRIHDFHERRYPFTVSDPHDVGAVASLAHTWRVRRVSTVPDEKD